MRASQKQLLHPNPLKRRLQRCDSFRVLTKEPWEFWRTPGFSRGTEGPEFSKHSHGRPHAKKSICVPGSPALTCMPAGRWALYHSAGGCSANRKPWKVWSQQQSNLSEQRLWPRKKLKEWAWGVRAVGFDAQVCCDPGWGLWEDAALSSSFVLGNQLSKTKWIAMHPEGLFPPLGSILAIMPFLIRRVAIRFPGAWGSWNLRLRSCRI